VRNSAFASSVVDACDHGRRDRPTLRYHRQAYLVLKQIVHASAVDTNQNEVGRLSTSLQAKTGAGQLNKDRRAPTRAGTACSNALAVLCTDQKRSLL